MKIMGTFGVVVIASIALLQPAEGRQRGGGGGGHGRSFSSGHNFSSGSGRNFSRSSPNYYRSSPRVSSQAAYRNRGYRGSGASRQFSSASAYRNRDYSASGRRRAVDRTTALNPRAYSDSRQRVSGNRRSDLRRQGFNNNNQGRVHARYSRNWSRNRDHNWHGNRCRWRNNSWVIIGPWFYPWGYGYYPYGAYSYYDSGYYDSGYYDDGYASSDYSEAPSRAEYDSGAADFSVSGVQSALAREGYYDGPIDGSLGPATRNALRRYQRDRGLSVTGRIDRAVVQALGLRS